MKFSSLLVAAAALSTFALGVSNAEASPIAPAPIAQIAGKTILVRNALLLTSPYIGEDLKLTSTQIAKRNVIIDAYNHRVARIGADVGVTEGASAKYRASLDAADAEYAASLLGLLTPTQAKRMKQLAIQSEGLEALRDPAIATELGLSAAQKPKVAALFANTDQAREAYENAVGDALDKIPTPGDSPEEMKAYEKRQAAVMAAMQPKLKQFQRTEVLNQNKIKAMFTPAQKTKWTAMLGKPMRKV